MKTVLAMLACLAISTACAAAPSSDGIVRHVAVIDVESGQMRHNQAVALRDGTIVVVGADAQIAKTWRTGRQVDGKGRYLLPGLWVVSAITGVSCIHGREGRAAAARRANLPLPSVHAGWLCRDRGGELAHEAEVVAPDMPANRHRT